MDKSIATQALIPLLLCPFGSRQFPYTPYTANIPSSQPLGPLFCQLYDGLSSEFRHVRGVCTKTALIIPYQATISVVKEHTILQELAMEV